MPRSRLNRVGLFLTAVFQLLLPTFASVADARAESGSERAASVHVESHSTSHCVPVHPADCTVCQVIGAGATPGRAPSLPVLAARVISAGIPRYTDRAIRESVRGQRSPRAPPLV